MNHQRETDRAGFGGVVSAQTAWAMSKGELRSEFGEGYYRSYIEPLDLAAEEDGAFVFVARNGRTQREWLDERARGSIVARMAAHMRTMRPIPVRICEYRDLSPILRDCLDRAPASGAGVGGEPPRDAPARPQWRGRFETFCEGPSNQKALRMARLVAERSGSVKMLLFSGAPGVGKTHLAEAIANAAVARDSMIEVRVISGQRFTEDFVDAVSRKRDPAAFKASLRSADILIIDDVPRVAGRKATEEELYDTIIAVLDRGGSVVLTAAGPLTGFGDRLAHHFSCATECAIDLPDQTLRRSILDSLVTQRAADYDGFAVTPEALDMIADRMPVSGRELDGALSQVFAEWMNGEGAVSLQRAEEALRSKLPDRERRVTVDMIKAAVAKHYAMSVAELMRKTREKAVSHPRQMAMYLSTKMTPLSLPNIARLFGGYDHTTVLYAKRKVASLLLTCNQTQRDSEAIVKLLRQPG
ncbi:MAG: ATP-binding protein [Hyphomonadaceae bacterium]|nr:ATP-binding protein [Hyphomonadaceae bacterium]